MSFGMQTRDAAGNISLDLAQRIGRILGTVDTGAGSSGNVTDANFANGTPFYFTLPKGALSNWFNPNISIAGNTLSWSFTGTSVPNDVRIFYGIY